MKVILTEYVYKHGVAGEVVNVADGFARNFLIPRRMAIPATKVNLEAQGTLREQATKNRQEITARINEASQRIDGVELVFGMKAGSNNKLYGSITSQMIKDALLTKTGLDINRRRISERPIRELGSYDIPVRMGEVSPMLKITVVREDEVNSYLAAKAAADAPATLPEAEAGEAAPVEVADSAETAE